MILLNLIDLATTLYALSLGAVELNPLSSYLLELGIYPLVKLSATPLFWWLWWKNRGLYWAVCGVYALIVLNNLFAIAILKGWLL